MVTNSSGVYVALGANLPGDRHATPRDTLEAAIVALADSGFSTVRRSSWWQSSPQPASDQPDFINGVVEISATGSPSSLLDLLHRIEADFGRTRRQRWEARILDLDLIDYRGQVSPGGAAGSPVLPHPRMAERLFVLLPLQEIAPAWRHPVSGAEIGILIDAAIPLNINKL